MRSESKSPFPKKRTTWGERQSVFVEDERMGMTPPKERLNSL